MLQSEKFVINKIGHFGIIAGMVFKLKIVEIIDKMLPKKAFNARVSHGQVVLAMIISNLGFCKRRLYNVCEFLRDKPLDTLIGPGVKAEYFNDDVLAATLDQISKYGVTSFYGNIAFLIAKEFSINIKDIFIDSTSLTLFGNYKNSSLADYGHSKDHRPDLKQIILNLVTTRVEGFPIFLEPLKGNTSDKTSFHETIDRVIKFQKSMGMNDIEFIGGDSALYNKKYLLNPEIYKIEEKNNGTFYWFTRIPETITSAKNLVEMDGEHFKWEKITDDYYISCHKSSYGGVQQRWIVVFSLETHVQQLETLNKKIDNHFQQIYKKVLKLEKMLFENKKDIETEMDVLKKKYKLYSFRHRIIKNYKISKNKTSKKNVAEYKVKIIYLQNTKEIRKKENSCGRFIIGTNCLNKEIASDKVIFSKYKNNQIKTERGFRFLKDKAFSVSDIFIKKDNRIEALTAIMGLTLMVYNYTEFHIRKRLKETGKSFPNQLKKPIKNPTLRWIFQSMEAVVAASFKVANKIFSEIHYLEDHHKTIINILGESAKKIYMVT